MRLHVAISAALILAAGASLPASASVLVTNQLGGSSGNAGQTRNGYGGTLGYQFTVGAQNLTVSELGILDLNGTGVGTNVGTETVQLYLNNDGTTANEAGTEVGTAVVPISASGTYDYAAFVPDATFTNTLLAGDTYTVVGDLTSSEDFYDGAATGYPATNTYGTGFNTTDVTNFQSRLGSIGSFPVSNEASVEGYLGPNLIYSVVPEPASLSLLALASGALLIRRSRRGTL